MQSNAILEKGRIFAEIFLVGLGVDPRTLSQEFIKEFCTRLARDPVANALSNFKSDPIAWVKERRRLREIFKETQVFMPISQVQLKRALPQERTVWQNLCSDALGVGDVRRKMFS